MPNNKQLLRLPDLAGTDALAEALAQSVGDKALVCLSGNLGTGKTRLVKATGKSLGIQEVISSPTFSVLNEYESGRLPFYHFDFYRLGENLMATGSSLEILALEVSEILNQPRVLAMIEWPEYFSIDGKNFFESIDRLDIKLIMGLEEERIAEIKSCGSDSDLIFTRLLNTLFKDEKTKEKYRLEETG